MSLNNSTSEIIKSVNSMKKIEQDLKNIFDVSRLSLEENINILSNYGWYISAEMEMKAIFKFNQLIKSEKQNEAEKLMLNFYKKNLNKLKGNIIVKFPERENIIKEAFIAHKKKMYNASTILFLSQADGICGAKIFRGPKVFNYNIDMKNNHSIINILGKETALNVDTRKTDKSNYFTNLNRHSVMHGLESDYGNEINSLKALSFLCFVSNFYNRYKK
jgi:hypothetical protein